MRQWIITSSVLILVLAVMRFLLRGKISPRLQYALWGLVLLRLLIPVSFGGTGMSVMNAVEGRLEAETPLYVWYSGDMGAVTPAAAPDDSAAASPAEKSEPGVHIAPYTGEVPANTAGIRITTFLKAFWLSGVGVFALWLLASNLRFAAGLRRSRRALEVRGSPLPVYVSELVDTPCLFGLFRPAVYVTPAAAENETVLRHSVGHETTHFRRGDHIWAILRGVCLALHWYNPLVWLAASLSRRDAELACDEATIKRIGEDERAEYGCTLIGLTCRKRADLMLAATTMTGARRGIRERITLIAKKPRMAIYTLVAVLLIAAVAVGCTFTGANGNDAEQTLYDCGGLTVAIPNEYAERLYVSDEPLENELIRVYEKQSYEESFADWGHHAGFLFSIVRYTPARHEQYLGSDGSGLTFFARDDNYYYGHGYATDVQFYRSDIDTYTEASLASWTELTDAADGILDDFVARNGLTAYSDDESTYDDELARWQSEVLLEGFAVRAEGSYAEIGRQWAQSYAAQYVDGAARDNPLYSADSAVLHCTLYAESLLSAPKRLIFDMRFACLADDARGFERWYVGHAGPLTDAEYPQYEGWMAFGWYVVLEQTGEGQWTCAGAGTGGYGGWGYLNYEETGYFDSRMEALLGGEEDTPENLLRVLPFADWAAFEEKWGSDGWDALLRTLDEIYLSEGRVYGPEETRMWADVYPDDQAYRILYVMLAASGSDGAYAEALADILAKQKAHAPELFEACLNDLALTYPQSGSSPAL